MRRATCQFAGYSHAKYISIHALREESDDSDEKAVEVVEFQSTLSVRRATKRQAGLSEHGDISIHALREESDPTCRQAYRIPCISIHALREESDLPSGLPEVGSVEISIHALREESDP